MVSKLDKLRFPIHAASCHIYAKSLVNYNRINNMALHNVPVNLSHWFQLPPPGIPNFDSAKFIALSLNREMPKGSNIFLHLPRRTRFVRSTHIKMT